MRTVELGRRHERGAALLEVLVALVIVVTVGVSAVAVTSASLFQEGHARERERLVRTADRVLSAYVLLTRADLDRRLGRREVGELMVEVQRPEPTLYRISVGTSRNPDAELLMTLVHRSGQP
jgi:type II secretory pathway component PulJ